VKTQSQVYLIARLHRARNSRANYNCHAIKQQNLLEEPGVGSRMGSNSKIGNKEVENEDMD
jgi:hypothetical protein